MLVRFVLLGTVCTNMKLSILGWHSQTIHIHPVDHSMLPFPYCWNLDWFECLGNIFLKGLEHVITVLTKPSLHHTPKELNEVQFTVKLEKKDAKMACHLNDFLDHWLLCLKVWLMLENVCGTASCCTLWMYKILRSDMKCGWQLSVFVVPVNIQDTTQTKWVWVKTVISKGLTSGQTWSVDDNWGRWI